MTLAESAPKILFQISGSIAAYKACFAVSRLVQSGAQVQVVATANALQFVGAASFEGLSGRPVFADVFAHGQVMDHIHLAKWADQAVIYPATANTLNRMAAGIADDPIGNLFLAWDRSKPYWVAPAMNHVMYSHPATQASLTKLREWGVKVLDPEHGYQACGDVGQGRVVEPEALIRMLLNREL